MGVVKMLSLGLMKHGRSEEEAQSAFWILDAEGENFELNWHSPIML